MKILHAILSLIVVVFVSTATAGQPVPAAAGPSRIVSLVPAVTEMLFAVGAGAQVIGVSNFDEYPPEVASRTRVGALIDPDMERILTLRPDLVITYGSQTDLERQLSRAAIPTYSYRHAGLADVTQTIRAVGTRVGHAVEAEKVAAAIEARLRRVRESVGNRPRPRVALVFDREPGTLRNIYASGGRGFLNDMLTLAGGVNAFADVNRESIQATSELILARRPEVILEVRSDGKGKGRGPAADGAWQALASVPAVQSKRVIALVGDQYVVPGPRIADAVEGIELALRR